MTMRRTSTIGIHLGGRYLAAAQVEAGGTRARLRSALVLERPAAGGELGVEDIQRLGEVLDRRGFVGRTVTLALPYRAMLTGYLDLPPRSSGAPIKQIARAELARTHRLDPTSMELALWDLPRVGRAGQGAPAMAVACAHEAGESLAALFESAGLEVAAIDAGPCALARATAPALDGVDGLGAIIEIGWVSSRLVIVKDSIVVYERVLAGAGQQGVLGALMDTLDLDEEIADYLLESIGIGGHEPDDRASWELLGEAQTLIREWADALCGEAEASIEYALRRYGHDRIGRVALVGANASMPGLDEAMGGALRTTVATPGPGALVECPGQTAAAGGDGRLVCALGLALRMDR